MSQRASGSPYALAYVAGAAILAANLIDIGVGGWPIALDQTLWRFRVVSQFGSQMPLTTVGLLFVIGGASMAEHTRTQRVLAVFCGGLAILVPLLLASYVLDTAQVRSVVGPDQAENVARGSIQAEIKLGLATILLALTSWIAWRTAGEAPDRSTPTIVSSSRRS